MARPTGARINLVRGSTSSFQSENARRCKPLYKTNDLKCHTNFFICFPVCKEDERSLLVLISFSLYITGFFDSLVGVSCNNDMIVHTLVSAACIPKTQKTL